MPPSVCDTAAEPPTPAATMENGSQPASSATEMNAHARRRAGGAIAPIPAPILMCRARPALYGGAQAQAPCPETPMSPIKDLRMTKELLHARIVRAKRRHSADQASLRNERPAR